MGTLTLLCNFTAEKLAVLVPFDTKRTGSSSVWIFTHALCGYNSSMQSRVSSRLFRKEYLQRCCLDECKAACCLHGVWLDVREAVDILEHASLIAEAMNPDHRDPNDWFAEKLEKDHHSVSGRVIHSRVVENVQHHGGTACVFLRDDSKCALQVAAIASSQHPWRFKPFYCILQPLDFDRRGRITLDKTSILLKEKGSCLRASTHSTPLLITFEPELTYLLGKKEYDRLLQNLKPTARNDLNAQRRS